ncbi:hypothetical protein L1887_23711 [Cichorium endivia]|nr:hypothetical protein L1887_23711 [Cichorium endivia]
MSASNTSITNEPKQITIETATPQTSNVTPPPAAYTPPIKKETIDKPGKTLKESTYGAKKRLPFGDKDDDPEEGKKKMKEHQN